MNSADIRAALLRIAAADLEAFTGPAVMLFDGFAVSDEEGVDLVDILAGCTPEPLPLPLGLAPAGVTLVVFLDTDVAGEVGAFIADTCVGVYVGASLYVLPEYRGRGIGSAICLAAAVARGGTVVGDWGMHGYCAAGMAAHEHAFKQLAVWAQRRLCTPGGRPLTLYHGSPNRPGAPAFGTPGNTLPRITPGRPFFVSNDRSYAQQFARGGRVQPLEARLSRPVDLDNLNVLEGLLARLKALPEAEEILTLMGNPEEPADAVGSAYFLLESPALMQQLMDEGYDGAVVTEDVERGIRSYALFYPDQVCLPPGRGLAPKGAAADPAP